MTALPGIATRMRLARLLLITDLRRDTADLSDLVAAALAAGVDIVQLRDPRADQAALAEGVDQLRETVAGRRALLGLYDDLDLAGRVQTDLLQLSERGPATAQARAGVHRWALLGRSCHSPRTVDEALADPGIDYLTVGPVVGGLFGSGGLDLVRHAARQAPPADPSAKPWFAVGGITLDNLDKVLQAGARRVAVSRAIADAERPGERAEAFAERLAAAWRADPGMDQVILGSMGPAGR